MKILVTGGAGFIGAYVAQRLAERGDTPVILDDFNDRYSPALKKARVAALVPPEVEIVRGDICDRDMLSRLFTEHQFDSVIHLAAWAAVQTSIERPHIYTAVNVDGTVNILEAARQHSVKHVVFASSSSVYGGLTETPFVETATVTRPISPYAASKVAGEVMAATWHNLYQLPVTCLRFFTVYGPWGRPEMAYFKFVEAVYRGEPIPMRGKATKRDFTFIDDIVEGVLAAHDQPAGFQIYNLGNNDAVDLPRFIAAIEAATGKKAAIEEVQLPPGDVPVTLADISRAQKAFGYAPTTTIETGVATFVEWYQQVYRPTFHP